MKIFERVGAVVTSFALWMITAFIAGALARPVAEAFMYGFNVWSN